MTRKLFRVGGLDVTLGKVIAAGVVVAAGIAGSCGLHSCGYRAGRNSVVDSDASVSVERGTVESAIKRPDRDKSGNIIGSTEYTVVSASSDETQVLDIQRNDSSSVVYTDSSLLDDKAGRMDGSVDKIYFPELDVTLIRSADYAANRRVFEDADSDLRAAKARFSNMD